MNRLCIGLAFLAGLLLAVRSMADTLPPLNLGEIPHSFDELWAGFDPRAEPLDVEILREWEEDGVVLQVLRYRIGVFKGQKAMMAAVYGYPKGGTDLPGLVQIHGGGQYADYRAPLTNAKRGYATLSISWAGRINAPDHKVTPAEVKLFWAGATGDPAYRVTTDWGALDGYHAPYRYSGGNSMGVEATDWTLDSVESPRNAPYFLWTLAARRALTFLENQDVVDGNKLGVYGHSMGAKITVLTAGSDDRVKAAAPSCGGVSNTTDSPLYQKTLADAVYLARIECPILFQSPSNDFHGRIDDLQTAVSEIQSDAWRVTCAAHHNHQDTAPYEVASQLWFDEHLKGTFAFPQTPDLEVNLATSGGVPTVTVQVDASKPVLSVDFYYTQHGQIDGLKDDRENTKAKFWHHAKAVGQGDVWRGRIPVVDTVRPLWVYANVRYALEQTVGVAGYYYRVRESDQFNLSSLMFRATGDELKSAGVQSVLRPSLVIEDFQGDWEKEWYAYKPEEGWGLSTHKVYEQLWHAPAGAKLSLWVSAAETNILVVRLDGHAAEVPLSGGSSWQRVDLAAEDFKNAAGESRLDFEGIRELCLSDHETIKGPSGSDQRRTLGGKWQGAPPRFRDLWWSGSNAASENESGR